MPFKEVLFTPGVKTHALGRNRMTKMVGLELFDDNVDRVLLTPINTTGSPAKGCFMELPRCKKTLQALSQALSDLASTLP
ncbi:hypothetical protein [Burkholderia cenocepacia]|uniref:hypothetical protein n=1 Tax=Burkholderia cenocepacia TaxID=95486 RepID=UPI00076C696D|nr:hypothetical protein [Burkholderia cenocepacia]KWU19039.1 hypothetical protein AS149_12390 [Burkholderia cenocepacia]